MAAATTGLGPGRYTHDWRDFNSGVLHIEAINGDGLDFGAGSEIPAVFAARQKTSVRFVAVTHEDHKHQATLARKDALSRSNSSVFDPIPPRTSIAAERRHRQERLAGAFRLFARFGFAQGLAGHITARDPELTDHFWVNPLGVHFSRIKVSDLLLVNSRGETVIGHRPLNKAAFAIHAAIHEHNPKIIAAAHTHSTYGKAWSTLGRPLDTLTQDACVFHGDMALFDDFTGMVEAEPELLK